MRMLKLLISNLIKAVEADRIKNIGSIPAGHRKCSKCCKILPDDEFCLRANGFYFRYCKLCDAKRARDRRAEQAAKRKEKEDK